MDQSLYVKIPIDLYELLREYAYERKISKREVVRDALASYLEKRGEVVNG